MFIFAYGSLIWNPNFNYSRKFKGTLNGYKRDYSIIETHHRGNESSHGLVMGIHEKEQHKTDGILFHINDKHWKEAYQYLQQRENPNESYYIEKELEIDSIFGSIKALTFVSNKDSSTFSKVNCPILKAKIISSASGKSGTNLDYFNSSLKSLTELNLIDENDVHFSINKFLN